MDGNEHYVRIGEARKRLGVSISTIRRWSDSGQIKSVRLPSGQRIIDISSVLDSDQTSKKASSATIRSTIFYTRVSSYKQRDDLERQKNYLQENYHQEEGKSIHIHDIASGLNFKRKGLIKILESVKNGAVQRVVVASKDRLARFGFELIEWICGEYGTEIVVLDNNCNTPTEELGKDLLSIVQIYCCKWNGSRRYKASPKIKNDQEKLETKTVSNREAKANP